MPTMPNVVGLEYPAALVALVAAGVRVLPLGYFQTDPVTLTWIPRSAAAKQGFVTVQVPASGATNVAANSAVTLTVGNYPVSVAYPAGNPNV
jgi:beta-lactam-binding protein with PASTA domain